MTPDWKASDFTAEEIDEALEWQIDFAHGEPAPPQSRWKEFQTWLDASPRHAALYQLLVAFHRRVVDMAVRWGRRKPLPDDN